jgi:hypothetical protein
MGFFVCGQKENSTYQNTGEEPKDSEKARFRGGHSLLNLWSFLGIKLCNRLEVT